MRCSFDVGDQQHVRAVAVELEPFGDVLAQHRRRERPERFAELDLEVHHRLHLRRPGIADDRAAAERARAELHPALQQADDLFGCQMPGDRFGQRRAIDARRDPAAVHRPHCLDLRFGILRAQIRAAHAVGVLRHGRRRAPSTAAATCPSTRDCCARLAKMLVPEAHARRRARRRHRRPRAESRSDRTALRAAPGRCRRS